MALSQRWKTASFFSRVVTRSEGTATRRNFAAITAAPETRPSRFSDSAQLKEPGILKGGGDKPPLRPVWVATQGLEVEVEVEVEVKVAIEQPKLFSDP